MRRSNLPSISVDIHVFPLRCVKVLEMLRHVTSQCRSFTSDAVQDKRDIAKDFVTRQI